MVTRKGLQSWSRGVGAAFLPAARGGQEGATAPLYDQWM